MLALKKQYDALVIGGGFYGAVVSLELRKSFSKVLLVEKQSDLMGRASYRNQARIHQGYHYPRSILTSLRSRVNFSRFVEEYSECVYSGFEKYYAIGRLLSKVNASQFYTFCHRIGAPIRVASKEVKKLFNPDLIEEVFLVTEYAFDAVRLKALMETQLQETGVDVALQTTVLRVEERGDYVAVLCNQGEENKHINTGYVFNCTYSQINQVLRASGLPIIPLKHELTEMALIDPPNELRNLGITVMDGPFFSCMPFPALKIHSLSHVRYTPHHYWEDASGSPYIDAHAYFHSHRPQSRYVHMLKDAQRYLPIIADSRYAESLWEVKTLLPRSEMDDSRPILYRHSDQLPSLVSVLGG
jgi:glycine/D-amino acid oxidase-like deaminating enzyme